MWQHVLLCGIGKKPVALLMQYHLLLWEVAKVKQLMNSNMTLTVLNLHQKTPKGATTKILYLFIWGFTSLSTLYRSYHDG